MNNILFLCVGDSNIIGDSLGPLIGSFIKNNKNMIFPKKKIEVIGTMNKPIGYNSLDRYINKNNEIKKNNTFIIIDSALGSRKHIGKIIVDKSSLYAGNGINEGKILKGDILIRGIVGKNYNDNILNSRELKNIKAKEIDNIASKIIINILPFLFKV